MKPEATVFIVDDDAEMRSALYRMVRLAGMRAESFDSAVSFLAAYHSDRPGCLLLDVRMPCMSGLELQQRLKEAQIHLPVVFMSGYGCVTDAVEAMKMGALDFIEKPFDNERMLARLKDAIRTDAQARFERLRDSDTRQRLSSLTPREGEIMNLLVAGNSNKGIADQLGLSVRTVESHRANVMAKMQADTLSELVKMALDFAVHKKDK